MSRYGKVANGQYEIIVRSFAPFKTFGGGFDGDDRGFSSSLGVTSRITETLDVNIPHGAVNARAWSDPSHHKLIDAVANTPAEMMVGGMNLVEQMLPVSPSVKRSLSLKHTLPPPIRVTRTATDHVQASAHPTERGGEEISSHVEGANPLVPVAPDIDVEAEVEVSVDNGMLRLGGALLGDRFPNAEVLVRDVAGNVALVHGFETPYGALDGPLHLFGKGTAPMGAFNVTIPLQDDGNFLPAALPAISGRFEGRGGPK